MSGHGGGEGMEGKASTLFFVLAFLKISWFPFDFQSYLYKYLSR